MLRGEYIWTITSELANQHVPKALFTCVVYTIITIIANVELSQIVWCAIFMFHLSTNAAPEFL